MPNFSRVCQLLRRVEAASPDRPESCTDALTALAEVGGHLTSVRRGCVVAARSAGLSWTEIGAALGVSRQGAHQLFRDIEDGRRAQDRIAGRRMTSRSRDREGSG